MRRVLCILVISALLVGILATAVFAGSNRLSCNNKHDKLGKDEVCSETSEQHATEFYEWYTCGRAIFGKGCWNDKQCITKAEKAYGTDGSGRICKVLISKSYSKTAGCSGFVEQNPNG